MHNWVGQVIGRYHVRELLGKGGMAVVYKAYDTRLEREVALKAIRTELFGSEIIDYILRRFQREAVAMARLDHPNIIKVHDFGEFQEAPYLVMQYIPGGTLKDRVGQPLPWQEAIQITMPIISALEYAHNKGILHRDIKPSNILFSENHQPMIADFGIAKILEGDPGTTISIAGMGIGTPEYMAPEQGLGKPVDQRADVYSLGVVLYELVTGQKPFTADTPMEVIYKHNNNPLPPLKTFIPDLPDPVERSISTSLAKQPADRYENMHSMGLALESLQKYQQIPQPEAPKAVFSVPRTAAADVSTEDDPSTARGHAQERIRRPQRDPDNPSQGYLGETVDQLPMGEPGPLPRAARLPGWMYALGFSLVLLIAWAIYAATRPKPFEALPGVEATLTIMPSATVLPTIQPEIPLADSRGTPLPQVQSTLSSETITRAQRVAQWGSGGASAVRSPDGKTLVGAGAFQITFLDPQSLQVQQTIPIPAPSYDLTFCANSQLIAFGLEDGSILIYSTGERQLVRKFENTGLISTLAFSPDCQTLAYGLVSADQRRILFVRLNDGSLVQTIDNQNGTAGALVFLPSGDMVVTGYYNDPVIRVWKIADGALVRSLEGHESDVSSLSISRTGLLASGSFNDKEIRIWDPSNGTVIRTLDAPGRISQVIFSPDGEFLAGGNFDGLVSIWRTSDGGLVNTFTFNSYVGMLSFSPDGKNLTIDTGGAIEVRDIFSGSLLNRFEENLVGVRRTVLSPDGTLLADATLGGEIQLLNARDGSLVKKLTGGTGEFYNLAFSKDGMLLAGGGSRNSAWVWDVSSGTLLTSIPDLENIVTGVAFSPDNRLIAASLGNLVKVWRIDDGSLVYQLESDHYWITCVLFTNDGQFLLSGDEDKTIKFWDMQDGSLSRTLTGGAEINDIRFSADEKRLASGLWDGSIEIWDVTGGFILQKLSPPNLETASTSSASNRSIAFSADGRMIASGPVDDHLVYVWDVDSGQLLRKLEGHRAGVDNLGFTPDGRWLFSGSYDGTLMWWGILE